MARHTSGNNSRKKPLNVPPLPHPSWDITGTSALPRRISSSQEAHKIMAQFWETIDA